MRLSIAALSRQLFQRSQFLHLQPGPDVIQMTPIGTLRVERKEVRGGVRRRVRPLVAVRNGRERESLPHRRIIQIVSHPFLEQQALRIAQINAVGLPAPLPRRRQLSRVESPGPSLPRQRQRSRCRLWHTIAQTALPLVAERRSFSAPAEHRVHTLPAAGPTAPVPAQTWRSIPAPNRTADSNRTADRSASAALPQKTAAHRCLPPGTVGPATAPHTAPSAIHDAAGNRSAGIYPRTMHTPPTAPATAATPANAPPPAETNRSRRGFAPQPSAPMPCSDHPSGSMLPRITSRARYIEQNASKSGCRCETSQTTSDLSNRSAKRRCNFLRQMQHARRRRRIRMRIEMIVDDGARLAVAGPRRAAHIQRNFILVQSLRRTVGIGSIARRRLEVRAEVYVAVSKLHPTLGQPYSHSIVSWPTGILSRATPKVLHRVGVDSSGAECLLLRIGNNGRLQWRRLFLSASAARRRTAGHHRLIVPAKIQHVIAMVGQKRLQLNRLRARRFSAHVHANHERIGRFQNNRRIAVRFNLQFRPRIWPGCALRRGPLCASCGRRRWRWNRCRQPFSRRWLCLPRGPGDAGR